MRNPVLRKRQTQRRHDSSRRKLSDAGIRDPDVSERHADIFTSDEAAAYLGLSPERFATLCERFGVKRVPELDAFHRQDLNALVDALLRERETSAAHAPSRPHNRGRPPKRRHDRLTPEVSAS